ncbi:unnamed protein product, partial [Protopolystoma xenopodis]
MEYRISSQSPAISTVETSVPSPSQTVAKCSSLSSFVCRSLRTSPKSPSSVASQVRGFPDPEASLNPEASEAAGTLFDRLDSLSVLQLPSDAGLSASPRSARSFPPSNLPSISQLRGPDSIEPQWRQDTSTNRAQLGSLAGENCRVEAGALLATDEVDILIMNTGAEDEQDGVDEEEEDEEQEANQLRLEEDIVRNLGGNLDTNDQAP